MAMSMQVPKALAGKDGTTLSVGIYLALVFQQTLLPVAGWVTSKLLGDGDGPSLASSDVDAKDGLFRPLVVLVFAVVAVELVLWLMSYMKNKK